MQSRRPSVLLAAAAVLMLAACGGATTTRSTEDASTDGSTATDGTANGPDANADASGDATACDSCIDAASDVHLSLCPASPPAPGSACTLADGEECEYGSSWWLSCNLVLRCQGGTWQQAGVGGLCVGQDSGGMCPATWAEANAIDAGNVVGPCPAPDCQYPEGYCECLTGCGGGGAPHPMLLMGRWYCAPSTADCPSPRPDLGTACSSDASCQYGEPCGCGQSLQCTGGVWQGYPIPPCP
ncbi:MAG TPA: hypothetical protein VF765_31365 [Polyangiaceae bacterium]